MNKNIQIATLIITLFLTSCSFIPGLSGTGEISERNYEMITVSDLQDLQGSEAFTLINVHIPNTGNIPGTHLEIPYDEIANYSDVLPEDKDEKIIIYCRSGSMGDTASATLVEMGYSDVSNLVGGYIAWSAAGLDFEEKK